MKICGCDNCRRNGEVNLHENFEIYCSTREFETKAIFEDIFRISYTVGEMNDLYEELEDKFEKVNVVERIKPYTSMSPDIYRTNNWFGYGGPYEI